MRVAVLIGGLYNTFELCFPRLISKLQERFDEIDVYLSIWDVPVAGKNKHKFEQKLCGNVPNNLTIDYLSSVVAKNTPGVNLFLDIEDFETSKKLMSNYEHKLSMTSKIREHPDWYHLEYISFLYKRNRVFKMVKNHERYDWFVVARTDTYFEHIPDLEVSTPTSYITPYVWEDPNYKVSTSSKMMNANFYFTNSYNSLKKHLQVCFENYHLYWTGNECSEGLEYIFWTRQGLFSHSRYFDFKFDILRMNGRIQKNGVYPEKR